MIGDTYHSLETSVYNAPCLCIPLISGLSTPSNSAPDAGVTNGTCIYVHLTGLTGPNPEQPQIISTLPIISPNNQVYGGKLAAFSAKILPKLELEGYIDTPCTQQGEYFISTVVDSNHIPYLYTEVIAMMLEGRANWTSAGGWDRLDPLWFRDPWGRVYNNPVIFDFQASYVEGIPERSQFSLTLRI